MKHLKKESFLRLVVSLLCICVLSVSYGKKSYGNPLGKGNNTFYTNTELLNSTLSENETSLDNKGLQDKDTISVEINDFLSAFRVDDKERYMNYTEILPYLTENEFYESNFGFFSTVDKVAEFPGGMKAMYKFIYDNLEYPQQAIKNGVEGVVLVRFTVDDYGEVSEIKTTRDIGSGCGLEAERVISLMPSWQPAKEGNDDWCMEFDIPIKFSLSDKNLVGKVAKKNSKINRKKLVRYEGYEISNDDRFYYQNYKEVLPYLSNNEFYDYNWEVFRKIDNAAEFPGGRDAMYKFIEDNLIYPRQAKKEGKQGVVFVSVSIDEKGELTNIYPAGDIGSGCIEEAMRVVKLMPNWKPAKRNGKAVIMHSFIPIKFALPDIETAKNESNKVERKMYSRFDAEKMMEEFDSNYIFLSPDEGAVFPDGFEAMYKFLADNMKYPQQAKENDVQGMCYISFIVEKDGTLSDIKILQDLGYGCGEEAMRVAGLMPRWKPAKHKGKIVRQEFHLPIRFTLSDKK